LLLEVCSERADQQEVVGQGVREGVEHQTVPVRRFDVLARGVYSIVQMASFSVNEVLDQSNQLRWHNPHLCLSARNSGCVSGLWSGRDGVADVLRRCATVRPC
jgi:hypothetical protein